MSDSKTKYFVHSYAEWMESQPGEYYQDYYGVAATFENLDEAIEYAKRKYNTTIGYTFKVKDDACYYDNGKNKVFYDTESEFANWY